MKEKIYSGKIIGLSVHEITIHGRKVKKEIIEHPGAAAILAIDENSKVILVKQDRYPHDQTIEVPAGTLEKGEEPIECAKRELQEETGYIAKEMIHMTSFYPSIGYNSEIIHCYLAKGLKDTGTQNTDTDEHITILKMDYKKFLQEIKDGNIIDSKTICCGLLYDHL